MAMGDLVGCPHCTRPITFVRELAGQVIGCPHCGGKLQMPNAALGRAPAPAPPPPTYAAAPNYSYSPPPPPPSSRSMQLDDVESTPRKQPEPEPWFYGYIDGYTKFVLWLGILLQIGAALLIGSQVMRPLVLELIEDQGPRGYVLAALIGIAGLLVMAFEIVVFIYGLSFILLAVDAARNLRTMRMRQNKE